MFVFSIIILKTNGGLNMRINAISSTNYTTNFTAKKHNPVKNAARNAAVATMVLVPTIALPTSCNDYLYVSAHASASMGGSNSGGETEEFQFPRQIMDSLNYYRGNILDITADGDDGDYKNKALTYASANRNWDYNRPEYIELNLEKSDNDEARYDHVIIRNNNNPDDPEDIKNDIRITLVKKGDLYVVKKDGTITDQVSGLLLNEDGVKTFIHSNGSDKIWKS